MTTPTSRPTAPEAPPPAAAASYVGGSSKIATLSSPSSTMPADSNASTHPNAKATSYSAGLRKLRMRKREQLVKLGMDD